jgi:hypothetical protein
MHTGEGGGGEGGLTPKNCHIKMQSKEFDQNPKDPPSPGFPTKPLFIMTWAGAWMSYLDAHGLTIQGKGVAQILAGFRGFPDKIARWDYYSGFYCIFINTFFWKFGIGVLCYIASPLTPHHVNLLCFNIVWFQMKFCWTLKSRGR